MRLLTLVLLVLLALLQYRLWYGTGSYPQLQNLRHRQALQIAENQRLRDRNIALAAEVIDLKHGKAAVEERARSELGMIKAEETFYQIVE